jgi:hypothetical protein
VNSAAFGPEGLEAVRATGNVANTPYLFMVIADVGKSLIRLCVTLCDPAPACAPSRVRFPPAAVHGALERLQPIDLSFSLAAAPRLGVPNGLAVAGQGSREYLHRRRSRTSGIGNDAIKRFGVGAAS